MKICNSRRDRGIESNAGSEQQQTPTLVLPEATPWHHHPAQATLSILPWDTAGKRAVIKDPQVHMCNLRGGGQGPPGAISLDFLPRESIRVGREQHGLS